MKPYSIWQGNLQQRIFRELVEAFSRPGEIRDLTDWIDGTNARRVVLATLMDGESTLADPHGLIPDEDWPLLQARRDSIDSARYIAVDGRRAASFDPCLGSLESPEFGATLLIAVEAIGTGSFSVALTGPGIKEQRGLFLAGLHPDWLARRVDWVSTFPLGADILFCDAKRIVALPRTTHVANSAGVV